MKLLKLLKTPRIITLIVLLIFASIAIHPSFESGGVAIRNVVENSSADLAGLESPKPTTPPMSREVITSVENVPVTDTDDFFAKISELDKGITANIKTNKGSYFVKIEENRSLGLSVYDAPTSNIRKGLDLEGGTRVLLQPEEKLDKSDIGFLIENMKRRLNVYGLSDLVIREANDLAPPFGSGNQYVVVEIAGATEEEVKTLLAQQGKFEARISNQTAFTGGDDIRTVCRSADCAGIDPQFGCSPGSSAHGGGWVCGFRFSISLSLEAAENQADLTRNLGVYTDENNQRYLEEQLLLYLDDVQVDQLNIGADLRGRAVTDIQISGTGVGASQQAAAIDALQSMKELQTLLITGSLPVKIDIVKTDTISPLLGAEFISNALLIGALALLSVAIVIFIRYRKWKVSAAMAVTMICEVVLLLGIAALIGWNLDLAAIAGIIIAVGTGVDHQIVITDETLGRKNQNYNWKTKLKRALFIILAAYSTTVVAMLPLVFAGAGLLKGFAITTIIGVTIGVLITRPAYAKMIEILMKNEN